MDIATVDQPSEVHNNNPHLPVGNLTPSSTEGQQGIDLPRCYPRNCRGQPIFRGNQEALAWAIDNSVTITAYVGVGAFLATALLKLATNAAGCEVYPPAGETTVPPCNERIYGIKPSSLLSTMGSIVNVISASLMPIIGAIVDTTTYRRGIGRILVTCFCAFLFISIFISENTWFPIAILQIIWGFCVWFQGTITYSYLPDLTREEAIMNEYTRSFAVLSYVTTILYMGAMQGVSAGMGNLDGDKNQGNLDDEIKITQLAQSVSFTLCAVGLSIAWGFLFKKRDALRVLPLDEGSVWTAGFRQVGRTVVKIYQKYTQLKWFYISIMFCDPAIMALTILAITFLTDFLQFETKENATVITLMMLFTVPGSYIGSWVTKKFNAIVSSIGAVVLLMAATIAVSIVLKGPGQQMETYILSCGWGLGTGWKWTCDRMVLMLVLPPGQNTELMGVYIFFRQVIAWLPPLVFTILNERDISLRIGIATLNAYFFLSLLALFGVLVSRKRASVAEAQQNMEVKEESKEPDENPEDPRGVSEAPSNFNPKVQDGLRQK